MVRNKCEGRRSDWICVELISCICTRARSHARTCVHAMVGVHFDTCKGFERSGICLLACLPGCQHAGAGFGSLQSLFCDENMIARRCQDLFVQVKDTPPVQKVDVDGLSHGCNVVMRAF